MPPTLTARRRGGAASPPKPRKQRTVEFRKFKGVNRTDARTDIGDDELYNLINVLPVGNGALQLVPSEGASIATVTGARTIWGGTINSTAYMLVVASDGSITSVTLGGVTTVVCAAGTVTTSCHVTTYRAERFLIIDPTKGYFDWNGTTFTTIDATKLGSAIAVFEGRVWIGRTRTIEYTAPSTYNNFSAGDGAGSTIITDDAFTGNIVSLYSALEQLWVVGDASINAISNVQASGTSPNVTTTFSNTNIVTNLGSPFSNSVIAYFRALTLQAPFGAYALAGVTPQKLSDKLDGIYPMLTFSDTPAAIATVQSLPVLMWLVTYTGSDLPADLNATTAPLLLCFTQGKWFFGYQGATLVGITTVINTGVPQAWGCYSDGTIRQLFGGTGSVVYKIASKLYSFGESTTEKALMKVGVEIQASAEVDVDMTVDSEFGQDSVTVQTTNALELQNVALTAAERVVNGRFGSLSGAENYDNWTQVGVGTIEVHDGEVSITATTVCWLQQDVAIIAGRDHTFSVTVRGLNLDASQPLRLLITDGVSTTYFSHNKTTDGVETITTTLTAATLAGATSVRIQLRVAPTPPPTPTAYFSAVSLIDTVVAASGPTTLQLVGNVGQALNIVAQGTVLSRQNAALFGRYLGWTMQGTSIPFRVQAVQFLIVPTTEWLAGPNP